MDCGNPNLLMKVPRFPSLEKLTISMLNENCRGEGESKISNKTQSLAMEGNFQSRKILIKKNRTKEENRREKGKTTLKI